MILKRLEGLGKGNMVWHAQGWLGGGGGIGGGPGGGGGGVVDETERISENASQRVAKTFRCECEGGWGGCGGGGGGGGGGGWRGCPSNFWLLWVGRLRAPVRPRLGLCGLRLRLLLEERGRALNRGLGLILRWGLALSR